ncbi:conserved hypothetical protein [Deferribacter desulfuricans SSM1]|uniref:Uncharacterized protein n=1 Tax=Deferribacter desulfuricans (strain DSM 14783 / JCM 11476 / NBRC 101012 / SSM1) TaxID=639282 RepID=D3P9C1_DEFDS|nr:EAL domain-containing protein [Deferribacter desulfuricans]BAI81311.1 conserved hypothetical protein [Deferribacter desulfuricans SSM1]
MLFNLIREKIEDLLESKNIGILLLDKEFNIKLYNNEIKELFNVQNSIKGNKITDYLSVKEEAILLNNKKFIDKIYLRVSTKNQKRILSGYFLHSPNNEEYLIFLFRKFKITNEHLLEATKEINKILLRTNSEKELFDELIDILAYKLNCQVITITTKQGKYLKPILHFNKNIKDDTAKGVKVSIDERIPEGRGTASVAYRTNEIIVNEFTFNNENMYIWLIEQLKRGVISSCAIPIKFQDSVRYILLIYSHIPYFFDKRVLNILYDLKSNIEFTLSQIAKNQFLNFLSIAANKAYEWYLVTDSEGKIIYVNNAVELISGYSREELIGKKPNIFKSGEVPHHVYKNLWLDVKSSKEFEYTFINKRKDGKLFYLKSVIVPILENNKVIRIVNIARDITEEVYQKKKYERLNDAYNLLSYVNRLIVRASDINELFDNLLNVSTTLGKDSYGLILKFYGDYLRPTYYSKNIDDTAKKYLEKILSGRKPENYCSMIRSIKKKQIAFENDVKSNDELVVFKPIYEKYDINSCCFLPIIEKDEVVGSIVILAQEKDFFQDEILLLFYEVVKDLSFAINRIETEKWFKTINFALNNSFDFVVIMDEDFHILYINDSTAKIFGWDKEDIIGKHHSIFSSKTHTKEFAKNFYKTLQSGNVFSDFIVYKTADGKLIESYTVITPYFVKGEIKYYIAIGKDVSEQLKLKKEIEKLTKYSPITGLPLKDYFIEIVNNYLSEVKKENKTALVLLEPVNIYAASHILTKEEVEKLLNVIKSRLESSVKSTDILGMFQENIFGLLMKNIRLKEDIFSIMDRVFKELEEEYVIDNKTVKLEFYSGITFYPDNGNNAERLLKNSFIALKEGQQLNKKINFFDKFQEEKLVHSFNIFKKLHEAFKNNEFVPFFQPYVDSKTLSIEGAELLLRWQKDGEIIPPGKFIHVLEHSHLIGDVEIKMVEHVLEVLNNRLSKKLKIVPISINISPLSFSSDVFLEKFNTLLSSNKNLAKYIIIEIVERLFINDFEKMNNLLTSLKELGIQFSLDDFGTGYSSLNYISNLPIDKIKIDITFTRNIEFDKKVLSLVKTIKSFADELGLKTIAEGVENENQLNILKRLKINQLQGYLFYKPMDEISFWNLFDSY